MIASVISGTRRVRITSTTNHYHYPPFQGWQAAETVLRCQVSGDTAANERRPIMAQEYGSEAQVETRRGQVELSEDELEQVSAAGGGIRVGSDGANN